MCIAPLSSGVVVTSGKEEQKHLDKEQEKMADKQILGF